MGDFLFTAEYVHKDFKIVRYYILEETKDGYSTVTREGNPVTFPNTITKIAFSENDAILLLINSYSNKIDEAPHCSNELMFIQRQMQNAFERKYYYV